MADLLSLFRGSKRPGTNPKTTTPTPVGPVQAAPERSGAPPLITTGTAYEVVVPVPAPVLGSLPTGMYRPTDPPPLGIPGGGPGADTTGHHYMQVVSSSPTAPALPAAATFHMLEATTTAKTTVDGPLADRLYRLFTKGQA